MNASGPFCATDFENLLQSNLADYTFSFGIAAQVVGWWCWSKDERCADVLLKLPVQHHCVKDVGEMCTRSGSLNKRLLLLLKKYAAAISVMESPLIDRVARLCISTTRFCVELAADALLVLRKVTEQEPLLKHFIAIMYCCSELYPLSVRRVAASLASDHPQRYHQIIVNYFSDLVSLAPTSIGAAELLMYIEDSWLDEPVRAASMAHELCVAYKHPVSLPSAVLAILVKVAEQWPRQAVNNEVVLVLAQHDVVIPQAVLDLQRASQMPENEQFLLVYMIKYGCPPTGHAHLLRSVLLERSTSIRLAYVNQIRVSCSAQLPFALHDFDEKHTGVVSFVAQDSSTVDVLFAHLRRYSAFAEADENWDLQDTKLKAIASDMHPEAIKAYRHTLYYDYLPDDTEHLVQAAQLADRLSDDRHTVMLVRYLASTNFWQAWDLAHLWPACSTCLRAAGRNQLAQLVTCSRLPEIVDLVVAG